MINGTSCDSSIKFETEADKLIAEFESFAQYGNQPNTYDNVYTLYLNTNLFNNFIQSIDPVDYSFIKTTFPLFYDKYWDEKVISAVELKEIIDYSFVLTNDNFGSFLYTPDSIEDFKENVKDKTNEFPQSVLVYVGDNNLITTFGDVENTSDLVVWQQDHIFNNSGQTPTTVLKEIEDYLSLIKNEDAMSKSSFCSTAQNIFENIHEFTNLWNNIKNFGDKIREIQDKIAAFSMDALIERVTSYVKKKFEEAKQKIENLVIGNINKVKNFTDNVGKRITSKSLKMKEKAKEFFSGNVIDNIIDKIKAMAAYVVSLFDKVEIEEIEYIIYKFCQLSSTIDNIIDSEISPLKKMIQAHDEINLALKTSSNWNTAKAIQSGALRLPSQQYETGYSSLSSNMRQRSIEGNGNWNGPPSMVDVDGVTPYNDGKGDSRIGFQGGWVSNVGKEGWERVDSNVRMALMRVQARMGIRLIVNSGYRPPWYNAKVGGASKSQHMYGMALDITWSGFRSSSSAYKANFINICRNEGFRGFGGYNGFIHIDFGPTRSWGIHY